MSSGAARASSWVTHTTSRPTADALVRDLRRALAGRLVVCVTHDDDLTAPSDTVVNLDRVAERV